MSALKQNSRLLFGEPVYLEKLPDSGLCMQWSPVGMYLAVGLASGALAICKYKKHQTSRFKIISDAHKYGIQSLKWSPAECCPDGEIFLVSGGQDGKVRVWQLLNTKDADDHEANFLSRNQGSIQCGSDRNSGGWIQSIVWLPAESYCFAVAYKKQIIICSARDCAVLKVLPNEMSSTINHLSIDTRLNCLLVCSYGAVTLVDLTPGLMQWKTWELPEKGLMLVVESIPFTENPNTATASVIITGMQDEIAMVWAVDRDERGGQFRILQKLKLSGFAGKITNLSIDQREQRQIACSGSPAVILWDTGFNQEDVIAGSLNEKFCVGIRDTVTAVRFRPYVKSSNGTAKENILVAASRSGTVMAWNISSKPVINGQNREMYLPKAAFQGPDEAVALEWSRQGQVFSCSFVDGSIAFFECLNQPN